LKCHLEQFDRCEVDPEISELLDLLNTNSALCTYANVPNESGIVLVLKNGDRDNSKAKRRELCRSKVIQKYGKIHREDSEFNQIFVELFSNK
jgi:hypothetical protein